MRERTYLFLIVIIFIALVTGWINFANPHIRIGPVDAQTGKAVIDRELKPKLGLDLQGGLRVLLEADVPAGTIVTPESMQVARTIIEKRINALGVSEPLIQLQGSSRIAVELPGISNPEEAIRTFGSTGLLEFIAVGDQPVDQGTTVLTTGPTGDNSCTPGVVAGASAGTTPTIAPTLAPTLAPTATISATSGVTSTTGVTGTTPVTSTAPVTPTGPVYTTVMTGDCLSSASVAFQQTNAPIIQFSLKDKGAKLFGDYTSANVGKFLAIALDKKVISSPSINSAITQGSGIIEGKFSLQEAQDLAIQLRYGSLPIPLKIVDTNTIGPTLGQDSVNKSLLAGAVGLSVVVLFMLLYYRLPGLLADLALGVYASITFAIFKAGIPGLFDNVTLTLPGIAGFILSIGMAVDANVLIFERMKEELRAGRPLAIAIENGFNRAWPSIRDSNSSTLITCLILFWFGSNYGASIVAGFAITLALGVLVSLFTAITVTRTLLRLTLDFAATHNLWWFGV